MSYDSNLFIELRLKYSLLAEKHLTLGNFTFGHSATILPFAYIFKITRSVSCDGEIYAQNILVDHYRS